MSIFPKSAYSGNSASGCCHIGNSNFDRIGGSIIPSLEKAKHATPNRITFEYLLIKDFNDSDEDAFRLTKLLSNIPCKVNLLAYNENTLTNFKRPGEERIERFQDILMQKHYTVTYRRSRGRDISGACGQLSTLAKKAFSH